MKSKSAPLRVWRIIVSFLIFLFVFTSGFLLLFPLVRKGFSALTDISFFSTLFNLPFIGGLLFLSPFLAIVGAIIGLLNHLCIFLSSVINRGNDHACAKTIIGVGIALALIHAFDIILGFVFKASIVMSIFPLINGIYLVLIGKTLHHDIAPSEEPPEPSEPLRSIYNEQKQSNPFSSDKVGLINPYANTKINSEKDYDQYLWQFADDLLKCRTQRGGQHHESQERKTT